VAQSQVPPCPRRRNAQQDVLNYLVSEDGDEDEDEDEDEDGKVKAEGAPSIRDSP
jgi:hypothetical protein